MRSRIFSSSTSHVQKKLILMPSQYFSTQNFQTVNIYHLKQAHRYPLGVPIKEKKPEIFRRIVSCQLMLAHFLRRKKNPLVVAEGFMEDLTPAKYEEEKEYADQFQAVFKNGIPNLGSQLTSDQQDLFYRCGGVKILFYLGFLKTIHKSIHPKEGLMVKQTLEPYYADLKTLPKALYPWLFEIREQAAIKCCKEAASTIQSPEVDVFLTYGLLHDFRNAIQSLNDNAVKYAGDYDLTTNSQDSLIIPDKLNELIEAGQIDEIIAGGEINLEEIVYLYSEKPWLVKALGHYRINGAIKEGALTINQLKQLTEQQVHLLKSGFSGGSAIKAQVATMIEKNTPEPSYQLKR